MVKQCDPLDDVFGALASPVRRQVIDALSSGTRTTSELAAPHGMTLGGFMKHLQVLSDAGLIACAKEGRTVTCALTKAPLSQASQWLAGRHRLLNDRMDALGRHLYHQDEIATRNTASTARKRSAR